MRHHVFDIYQRPLSCLMWDRKAWSHQNFFVHLGVGLDPGNWILFLMIQVLIYIRNKHEIPLFDDVKEALARIDVAQDMKPDMKLGTKRLEYSGDVLEAIGGICNPWQVTSKAMMKDMRSEDARLVPDKFDETRDMMGQLALEIKTFAYYVYRSHPENSEYYTLLLLLGLVSPSDHEEHDAGAKDAGDTDKMMDREGKTCSQERKGANDDSIAKAEIKSSEEKDKSSQKALNPEERPHKHSEQAEEMIKSNPSGNASARTAKDLTPARRRSSSPRRNSSPLRRRPLNPEERPRKHSGQAEEIIESNPSSNASARTARDLTPLRRRSPSPRRSLSPLPRRNTPVLRRWNRTGDDKCKYASRSSEDVVVEEMRACVDKQAEGAQQRATKKTRFKRHWKEYDSTGDKRRNVSKHSASTRTTNDYRSYSGKGS